MRRPVWRWVVPTASSRCLASLLGSVRPAPAPPRAPRAVSSPPGAWVAAPRFGAAGLYLGPSPARRMRPAPIQSLDLPLAAASGLAADSPLCVPGGSHPAHGLSACLGDSAPRRGAAGGHPPPAVLRGFQDVPAIWCALPGSSTGAARLAWVGASSRQAGGRRRRRGCLATLSVFTN